MNGIFSDKIVVITGGTGSLGKIMTKRLLSGEEGTPRKVIIFSRDEAKQHSMRVSYETDKKSTDDITYYNFTRRLQFQIGDVRDYHSVCCVLKNADIIINAAALKQVPSCEYFPYEAVKTNIMGFQNIITAIKEHNLPVETIVGVSTDKAVAPLNVMGMTKAIQERMLISANISCPHTRFIGVRYGNVLASRGSVLPLFYEQISSGGPLTITTEDMTRFLLPLSKGADTIIMAIKTALPGEIYIPQVKSTKIINIAKALIGDKPIEIKIIGIRPGEKIHEILVSKEEAFRTYDRNGYYVIRPMLPELNLVTPETPPLNEEYSSENDLMDYEETKTMLEQHNLLSGVPQEK